MSSAFRYVVIGSLIFLSGCCLFCDSRVVSQRYAFQGVCTKPEHPHLDEQSEFSVKRSRDEWFLVPNEHLQDKGWPAVVGLERKQRVVVPDKESGTRSIKLKTLEKPIEPCKQFFDEEAFVPMQGHERWEGLLGFGLHKNKNCHYVNLRLLDRSKMGKGRDAFVWFTTCEDERHGGLYHTHSDD